MKEKINWLDVFKSSILISIPIFLWKLPELIEAIKS
ncbi:hypothetical protein F929_03408 [Acinetobacter lactucae]|uniref:Uncharacterized protein n=1 Tax=Acinetobacter lactucae TaxID=1785128 RepID=R8YVP8_9GAMM|nr:hypothetical protein F929_03408 [Acinetobacter lactucae]